MACLKPWLEELCRAPCRVSSIPRKSSEAQLVTLLAMSGFNLVHVDQASFAKKRKLGPGACKRCHERKVKCDGGMSSPLHPYRRALVGK